MANVVVLAGGDSDEREISLLSGAAVASALEEAGHNVTVLDPIDGLEKLLPAFREAEVVFPALHGLGGEDGVLQEFLERNNICFVGTGAAASKICFDKDLCTDLFEDHGVDVPKTELVSAEDFKSSELIKAPFVLKPNDGGSSIDTFIVRDLDLFDFNKVEPAFEEHGKMLLQEFIGGVEITVAVLGEAALPVIEIIPPAGGEFDYENKYNGKTQELCPPQNVLPETQIAAQKLAKKIHDFTNCRDMSRTDMIITDDQRLYVLENNTIPGLTNQSLLPKAAAYAGISMPEMCNLLVQNAIDRL